MPIVAESVRSRTDPVALAIASRRVSSARHLRCHAQPGEGSVHMLLPAYTRVIGVNTLLADADVRRIEQCPVNDAA